MRLVQRLESFVEALRRSGLARALLVDGSFVTAKQEPNDVDLVIALRRDHDFEKELRPFEYNSISKRRIRKTYGFDAIVTMDASPELDDAAAFYQQVRGRPDVVKGILKVLL